MCFIHSYIKVIFRKFNFDFYNFDIYIEKKQFLFNYLFITCSIYFYFHMVMLLIIL